MTVFSCVHLSSFLSPLVKYQDKSFAHFLIGKLVFFMLNFKRCLCILDTNPLSDMWLADILSQSVACPFILLLLSFFGRPELFFILTKFDFMNFPF